MMEGPGANSEEKREPVSDIDIAVADSLKVLDLKRPIREATYLPSGNQMTRWAICSHRFWACICGSYIRVSFSRSSAKRPNTEAQHKLGRLRFFQSCT
jgi:hypothetical protein